MRGLASLAAAAAGRTRDVSRWDWATVTQAAPLRVKFDGPEDETELDITTTSLVAGLDVDDRVWVQLVTNTDPARRACRLIVHGKAV